MNLDDPTGSPFDSGPFEAVFTAAADDESSDLHVLIPDFDDGENEFGPVVWQPLCDGTLPDEGDQALVVRSDLGRWWALAWTATPDTP